MELNPLGLPDIFDVSRWSHKEEQFYIKGLTCDRIQRQYTLRVQHLDHEEQRLQRKRDKLRNSNENSIIMGRLMEMEKGIFAQDTLMERLQSVLRDAVYLTQARKTLWDDLMSDEKGIEHVKWRFKYSHRSMNALRAQYEEVLRMDREWAQNTGAIFPTLKPKTKGPLVTGSG
ncbi:MAG: hypothetical protein LQ352_002585 [Teloschistes flavicans]|nr:MAG: hypothetical protein LQ352_002585 [Teloschistes flavicans]